MITNTQLLDKFERYTRNDSAVNREYGQDIMNQLRRQKAAGYDWMFLEKTYRQPTTQGESRYLLRADVQKVRSMSYAYDDTFNPLEEINSIDEYERLVYPTYEGVPSYFYIQNRHFELIATPQSTGDEVVINYKKKIIDLTEEDTTTGTVDVVNDSEIVSGTGTAWNQGHVGQYILLPDGNWYEVVAVAGANALTIDQPYIGTTDTSQAYRIGQVEIFPDGFEYLTLYIALADYFAGVDGGLNESTNWLNRAIDLEQRMKDEYRQKTTSVGIGDEASGIYNLIDGRMPYQF